MKKIQIKLVILGVVVFSGFIALSAKAETATSTVNNYYNNYNYYTYNYYNCNGTCASNSKTVFDIQDESFYKKFKGSIILRNQAHGEAYYVGNNKKVYYLGKDKDAFSNLISFGTGISEKNIKRIPVGIIGMYGIDSDRDGLSNDFENAIGTNPYNFNTDKDRYSDKVEITSGYNPNGTGRLPIDYGFTNSHKGKIFFQTEKGGEAWYVNPRDAKRYFMGNVYFADNIIRTLGIGVTEYQFSILVK